MPRRRADRLLTTTAETAPHYREQLHAHALRQLRAHLGPFFLVLANENGTDIQFTIAAPAGSAPGALRIMAAGLLDLADDYDEHPPPA